LGPEEVLVDHPERMRAMIVEASNPLLSYSDTSRWREACEALDLMVVIDTSMTESARLADYVLPAPVGYEKWEMALFPKGYPEIAVQIRPPVVPGPPEALPEPEIYTRLAEAMGVVPPMPEALPALAENALDPEGAGAVLLTAMQAAQGMRAALVFWSYRTVGKHLPSPCLAAIWALCHENAMGRRESVLRTLGEDWKDASPFAIGNELFQRMLDHPEGVEIARVDPATNFDDNLGWEDGRVRMAPPELLAEVGRAIENDLPKDPEYPLVLGAGRSSFPPRSTRRCAWATSGFPTDSEPSTRRTATASSRRSASTPTSSPTWPIVIRSRVVRTTSTHSVGSSGSGRSSTAAAE
jgi:anaerobic selenocysteine-containing dehydrogenase